MTAGQCKKFADTKVLMGDINFHCPFARENTQPAASLTIIFLDMSKAYFRLFSRAFPVTLAELW
jgi:hypothetical protein